MSVSLQQQQHAVDEQQLLHTTHSFSPILESVCITHSHSHSSVSSIPYAVYATAPLTVAATATPVTTTTTTPTTTADTFIHPRLLHCCCPALSPSLSLSSASPSLLRRCTTVLFHSRSSHTLAFVCGVLIGSTTLILLLLFIAPSLHIWLHSHLLSLSPTLPTALLFYCLCIIFTCPLTIGYSILLLIIGYIFGWYGCIIAYIGSITGGCLWFTITRIINRHYELHRRLHILLTAVTGTADGRTNICNFRIQRWYKYMSTVLSLSFRTHTTKLVCLLSLGILPYGWLNCLLALHSHVHAYPHIVIAGVVSRVKVVTYIWAGTTVRELTQVMGEKREWRIQDFIGLFVSLFFTFVIVAFVSWIAKRELERMKRQEEEEEGREERDEEDDSTEPSTATASRGRTQHDNSADDGEHLHSHSHSQSDDTYADGNAARQRLLQQQLSMRPPQLHSTLTSTGPSADDVLQSDHVDESDTAARESSSDSCISARAVADSSPQLIAVVDSPTAVFTPPSPTIAASAQSSSPSSGGCAYSPLSTDCEDEAEQEEDNPQQCDKEHNDSKPASMHTTPVIQRSCNMSARIDDAVDPLPLPALQLSS